MTIRGFFLTAAALAGFATATIAHAGESASGEVTSSVRVTYADLNISEPAGAKVLMLRVKRAAAEVCGLWSDGWDVKMVGPIRRCMTTAVSKAVAQINQQQIAAGKSSARPLMVAEAKPPSH